MYWTDWDISASLHLCIYFSLVEQLSPHLSFCAKRSVVLKMSMFCSNNVINVDN